MPTLTEGETLTPQSDVNTLSGAETGNDGQSGGEPRDFVAEARKHGWTEKDAFKGDPAKWVDAETFVKRSDEVMPFLSKQNKALKKEIDDLKRTFRQASEHFSKGEERAYKRAMADLEARHDEAVETGDVAAGRKVLKEMDDLKADAPKPIVIDDTGAKDEGDPAKEFADWVAGPGDWYVTDDKKRAYADIQAASMGPAKDFDGGGKAWLDELQKRVERKFAEKPTNPVNGGGNRSGANGSSGKSFADLPPEAKRVADKWIASGLIKSREDYAKAYDWS